MTKSNEIDRVVIVILDGLRSDAIPLFPLQCLRAIAPRGAWTFRGATVQPSITAAALTSLVTGVTPAVHGILSDRHVVTRSAARLESVPALMRANGIQTYCHLASVPFYARGLGAQVAAQFGAVTTFGGRNAAEIVTHALGRIADVGRALVIVHLPDADRAGHAAGWMSPQYRSAARAVDRAFERLVVKTGVLDDARTVVIALADHGGGGVDPHHHNSLHPRDTTIPIAILGARVAPRELPPGTSLLDVAATIPWLLGVETPASYEGRILREVLTVERPVKSTVLRLEAAAA